MQAGRLTRCEFISVFGCFADYRRAQQIERPRRLDVVMAIAETDPDAAPRIPSSLLARADEVIE